MESDVKVKAVNVSKVFSDGGNKVVAIENLNLDVRENEFTVLVGPSGCGKSTFLYMVAGFEKPTSGQILLDGHPITKPDSDRGFVFQEFILFPWRTVIDNIAFGLEMKGVNTNAARETAMKYIKMVGLEKFENAYPYSLSGGMKQRVGIARALAYDPEILLMDEPFGSLDAQTRKIMQKELVNIWEEAAKKTVLFVTHSVLEAVYLADKIYVLTARPGKIKGIIDVNLARPRNFRGTDFLEKRDEVLELLEEEVRKSMGENE